MDAGPQSGTQERTRTQRTRVIYETACALAESTTLVEAAPRMLEAICEALGWEYGALWRVDRAAARLRCVATWHPRQLPFDEFAAASRQTVFAGGDGLPGRVWASRAPAWIPDVVHDSNFPRASFADRVGLHAAFGFPVFGGAEVIGGDGVLQPGHPRARPGPARDVGDGRQPDRPVRRAEAGRGGAGPVFHAVGGPAVHRELRRVLPPPESVMGAHAGLHARGAAREAVVGLRPPRRPRGHSRREVDDRERRAAHRFRESVPVRGWHRTSGCSGRPSRTRTSA